MLLGLGDPTLTLPGALSEAGGINWSNWLQSGLAVSQTILTVATGQQPPAGHQTLTPNIAVPLAPAPASPASGVWAWLRSNWYIPVGLGILGVLAKGGRRR